MPMNFPDMSSLVEIATIYGFRTPKEGETEDEYRVAVADCVQPHDLVESCEIRNKVGWNKFSEEQKMDMLLRSSMSK